MTGRTVSSTSVVSEPLTVVDDALVLPATRLRKVDYPAAVVDRVGAPVVDSGTFAMTGHNPAYFLDRSKVNPVSHHDGSYLYAGAMRHHFGHFLFESTARLWAFDALRDRIDGIVMVSRPPGSGELGPMYQRILANLDVDAPLVFVDAPTTFERLFVPRQGCGLGAMSAGTPMFREFMQRKLRRIAPREDAPKVYLTRRGYGLRRGGIFAEDILQTHLEAEGYVAFSPEQHSFEEQISTYLGATHIISPDSSALHLVGFVAGTQTRIGIILRRLGGERDLLPQLAGFTGRVPVVVDVIQRILQNTGQRNVPWSMFAELDLHKAWRQLRDNGFLTSDTSWPAIDEDQRARLLEEYEQKLNAPFSVIWHRRPPPREADAGAQTPSTPVLATQ
jgi:hypothetical protein